MRLGAVDGAHLALRPVVGDGNIRLAVGNDLLGLIADALDAVRADGGAGAQLLTGGGQIVSNDAKASTNERSYCAAMVLSARMRPA